MLYITNSLTGKKELFIPLTEKQVLLYVCGVTPYDFSHLGHGRVYVAFDTLYRLLGWLGYTIRYCRNFTDIDCKLMAKAQQQYGDRMAYGDVADYYIAAFHRDMELLNCQMPTYEPRVTENMPAIIDFVQGLIDKGVAYISNGDVYFSIAEFPSYGALSKHKLEDLRAGARVEPNEKKRDPLDFALWKAEQAGQFWQAPWGWGRPGWHIECSALAAQYLGTQIDIHGGGQDLIFPHHENEIAQSQALFGLPLARYWMHNAFVRVDQEKMSKSLGNFFTLQDIFAHVEPIVIRFYLLNHHYRAPLDFVLAELEGVRKSYQRLCRVFDAVDVSDMMQVDVSSSPMVSEMLAFLRDDLNTVGMFGLLFERLSVVQKDEKELRAVKLFMNHVLGLPLQLLPDAAVALTPEIEQLIAERDQARAQKNWARADALRDQLKQLGYEVQDKKS